MLDKIIRKTLNIEDAETENKLAKGTDTSNVSGLSKAIKFFKNLGISFVRSEEVAPKGITIRIMDTDEVYVLSPFVYEMSMEQLISLHRSIKACGLSGKMIIQALTDAIQCLDEEVYVGLAHREEETDKERIFKMLKEYAMEFLKLHHIPRKSLSFANANTVYISLGGYKGLKHVFTRMFKDTYLALENSKKMQCPTFSFCNVCKHCKITVDGEAYCGKAMLAVPDGMEASDVSKIYNDVVIKDNQMFSRWLVEDIDECEFFKDRRPHSHHKK